MALQDWLLVIGFIVILIFAFDALFDPSGPFMSTRRKEDASGVLTGYAVAILDWICVVFFVDFRRGLETNAGLSETLSWVLAPIGLVLVIGLSIATWVSSQSDRGAWWTWVGPLVLCLAAFGGYLTVAVGPKAWTE